MNAWMHFTKGEMLSGYAASKGIPSPKLAVYGSGFLLFVGGLGVVLGVYTQWALWALVFFLIPVTFKMHAYWKVTDSSMQMMDKINFFKNLALLGAVLMMLAVPGPWSYVLF